MVPHPARPNRQHLVCVGLLGQNRNQMRVGFTQRTVCVGVFVLCAIANLWYSSIGWRHNLRELHEFRQIQTALSARYIQREGWSLAYPTPLFGPPWSAPMEFPVYQWCVARVSTLTGIPLEQSGRLVSLGFLYLSLPAFFLLLRFLRVAPSRRFLFLGLLLVTPLYLYYSRAFLIESAALCSAAWFLFAYCRSLDTGRRNVRRGDFPRPHSGHRRAHHQEASL